MDEWHPAQETWTDLVSSAMTEDIGAGDATSESIVDDTLRATAEMRARESMTICGVRVVEFIFRLMDSGVHVDLALRDGDSAREGDTILRVEGKARAILTAERVALNFIQHLSGIATKTRHFVSLIEGSPVQLLDTRKTTPGFRLLEKYAVKCGGGTNHRIGLFDMVMIKDNHLQALSQISDNPIQLGVERAREKFPDLKIEVEADELDQVKKAVDAGADIILLDNMSIDQMTSAVSLCKGKAKTEASGGITDETIAAIAKTGVDYISVGALTHSARNVDIGLDFQMQGEETPSES